MSVYKGVRMRQERVKKLQQKSQEADGGAPGGGSPKNAHGTLLV